MSAVGQNRSQFIQVMRFAAAALVLCTHVTFYYGERIDPGVKVWHFGEVGVPLFFAISGLVMVLSTARFDVGAASAKAFFLRRLIRVVPLYWLATTVKVLIAVAVPAVVNHNHFDWLHAIQSYFFIPYFNADGEIRPMHGVGWTLLHEMFFYLLFAAGLLLFRQPAWIVSVAVTALWLCGLGLKLDSAYWLVATNPINLNFVVGMLVGRQLTHPWSGPLTRNLGLGALAVLALAILIVEASLPEVPVPSLVLLLALVTLFADRLSLPRPVAACSRLGDSSYSLYLFHPFLAPAILVAINKLPLHFSVWMTLPLTVLAVIAMAHFIHLFIEVPVIEFVRRRFDGTYRFQASSP